MLRILFTGGGTGGHIYPILAVTEELQISSGQMDLELYYFGAAGQYQKLLETNGIQVAKILSAKIRRYSDFRNFIDILILFPLSVVQALWKVFWLMPDVLFSKGGPGSLPVAFACHIYRVPIIIHDSDSIVGLANRMAIPWANKVAVSFDSAIEPLLQKFKNSEKLRGKIGLVGNPVRRSLVSGAILQKQAGKRLFGFDSEKPMILIVAGSQGAVKINNFMLEIAEELIKDFSAQGGPASGWQILHQTGVKNFNEVKNELDIIMKNHSEEEKKCYKIVPYFEKNLKDAYAAADLIVCRGSAGSIFEAAAFGKPAILVPLSSEVAGEHQIANAYEYAKTGAAIVIEEENLKPNLFMAQLKSLFSDSEKLNSMSEAAKNFAKPEAAKIIAEEILRLGAKSGE